MSEPQIDHVYEHEQGYWVIAATAQEAALFYRRHQENVVGEDADPGLSDSAGWSPMADDAPFTFDFQGPVPEGERIPGGASLSARQGCITATAPAGAWATLGRQWLGSTEW